jgi:two-component system, chemotaxis family, CheB/CheR fusion protein
MSLVMKTPETKVPELVEEAENECIQNQKAPVNVRTTQRLQTILKRIRKVLDTIPQMAIVINKNGDDLYLNKKWNEFTGMASAEFCELKWKGLVFPDDIPPDHLWQNTKSTQPIEFECRLRKFNGEFHWHSFRALPIHEYGISLWISTVTDIHDKKVVEQQLQEEKYFIEKIAEATPDIIAVYNTVEKKYNYINSQIRYFTGINAVRFQTLEDFKPYIHPDDWTKFVRFHKRFNSAGEKVVKQIVFRSRTLKGGWLWFLKKGKAFKRSPDGKVTHIVTVTQDITDRKKAEEERRENQLMHELLIRKDEFLSEASHELKTPVTTIKSSLQILKRLFEKHAEDALLQVFLVKANQQVNKLTDLISNIMDNSKIHTGKFFLNIKTVDIQEIILDVMVHKQGNHEIEIENKVLRHVEADKHRLEQVLINFVTNAEKYSPAADKIIIRVSEQEENLLLEVQDFGIGIPDHLQAKIFERFYRVDHQSVQFSGLGLGLYISAEIIHFHHGEIGLRSEVGKGSTFWFSIPFQQPTGSGNEG